jgi:peptidylprolyl isomerase
MTPHLRRSRLALAAASALMLLAACGSDALSTPTPTAAAQSSSAGRQGGSCTPAPSPADNFAETVQLTTSSDGLQYGDITVGTGATPKKGQNLTVQYTGWLTTGCVFDSSRTAGRSPFSFVIGATPPNVILGWEEGVLTMRVGGKRRLVIPPALGYGAAGQGSIPGNATLIFDVELLSAA